MFDLVEKDHRQTPHRDTVPMMMSLGLHSMAVVMFFIVPLLYVTESIPPVRSMMMAFVAAAPPPPPPPLPPPLPPGAAQPEPVVEATPAAAPVDEPQEIESEPPPETSFDRAGDPEGLPGGVVAGGASLEAPPPPPPPPSPTQALRPVRIGGEIRQPALLSRVDPVYPLLAVGARVEGTVILEAVVDREGRVEDLRILRSIPTLDGAAIDAVRQWRYAPLLLNGEPVRFIIVVTVTFQLMAGTSS